MPVTVLMTNMFDLMMTRTEMMLKTLFADEDFVVARLAGGVM